MSRAFEQPLFHGTVEMISRIDVLRGRSQKDFGRGFYLALQAGQAVGMMNKKFSEAVKRSKGKDPAMFVKRLCCLCTQRAVDIGVKTFGPVNWRMFA